ALHATDPDVGHGALTPQRILIGPGSEVLICDYVLGSALEQLRYSGERYWTELGVPTRPDTAAFDRRLDVFQLGLVGLALLGRPPHPCRARVMPPRRRRWPAMSPVPVPTS